jgi:hypothetical protein
MCTVAWAACPRPSLAGGGDNGDCGWDSKANLLANGQATSTGELYHSGTELVTSMPYAIAMACALGAPGQANIDLRGTPFAVAPDEFMQGGYYASGTSDYSENHQVVNLTGDGYCGWTNPQPYIYNPFNGAGGFQLNLVYGAY